MSLMTLDDGFTDWKGILNEIDMLNALCEADEENIQ